MSGIDRRGALGLIGVGALAAAASPAVARTRTLDVQSAAGKLRAYILMRGALDERLVISYISGCYFGVVDSEVTPLWDVIGVTFTRYRARVDGGFDVFSGEIAHFLDPKTGEAPGEFLIPYTGKIAKDPRTNLPPSRYAILPDLQLQFSRVLPGMVTDHHVRDPEVRGDDIWFTDVTRTQAPIPGAPKPFRYSETVSMHAHVADLMKPGVKRVPTESNFTNFVDWRPWMNMAGHPGHLSAVGNGRFGVTMADLPERWTKATREKWPQILENPGGLLDPIYKPA
ncbi:DUF1838 domain-containing protein [Sphingomonas populi]|uniref:DUF1838 domain-containing protein n=1 Tax=Sphingomonas populi TaxID=2484750 RepID=A0A4Q6Y8M3_9SPHN|nr:DUF1838 family protein [Sphingomonas populi]RZF66037.1 DUF1838 domain-containing protein [Sphingomonas populi]